MKNGVPDVPAVPTRITNGKPGTAKVHRGTASGTSPCSKQTAQPSERWVFGTASTAILKSVFFLNIAAYRRDNKDEKPEKADFWKMIENKNSKHMIMVPKSPFSAIFVTRFVEKFLLVGEEIPKPL